MSPMAMMLVEFELASQTLPAVMVGYLSASDPLFTSW